MIEILTALYNNPVSAVILLIGLILLEYIIAMLILALVMNDKNNEGI